jgi:hypothetical protein
MKRAVRIVALIAVILLVCLSAYLRIEQYRFRRQAERLLSDVRELELKKASAAEVRLVVRKWGFEEWQGPDKPCSEDECIYRFTMARPAVAANFPTPLMGPTVVFDWLGLRPSAIDLWIRIRGKALRSVSFSVYTIGRGCDRSGCTLLGHVGTKHEAGSMSAHDEPDINLKHSLLHPTYLVGAHPTTLNPDTGASPTIVVWAEFSADADTADVSHLMQFDLSCLTRLRPCKERDLMPTVWAQSIEDIRESPKNLTCTPELSKRVAQLSDVIAVVRPKTAELSSPRYDGRRPRLRNLEIIDVIRKPEDLRPLVRSDIDIDVDRPEMMTTADTGAPIRASQQYVFLLQNRNDPDIAWFALYPCGALSFNASNLAMVRDAAANGTD